VAPDEVRPVVPVGPALVTGGELAAGDQQPYRAAGRIVGDGGVQVGRALTGQPEGHVDTDPGARMAPGQAGPVVAGDVAYPPAVAPQDGAHGGVQLVVLQGQ
jgi:hypothetical protein